ncbi:MAG TPA: carbon-nitrogen hydrolase family protein [Symbiobacteriaceae bacterium]|nr:carbon-nitrogen hydrolase family protein [Symbiobacteriaceae bacterium]
MSILRVALLQLTAHGADQEANLAKGLEACRQARAMGADIALFPEMWSIGYALNNANAERAIGPDSAFLKAFQALARELGLAIAITYLEQWPPRSGIKGAPRNTVSLIDCHGEIKLTYAKVHTCDFGDEGLLTPGDAFPVCTLATRAGAIQIGAMICYDREFPESARALMLGGAEIILVPNACTLDQNRLAQFQTRAFENMVGVAMANYAAPQNNGHSSAFDGIAHGEIDGPGREMKVVEAGEAEGIYLAPFDLDALRAYRERESWGNAYRKPHTYGSLVETGVRAPFIRPDSRR